MQKKVSFALPADEAEGTQAPRIDVTSGDSYDIYLHLLEEIVRDMAEQIRDLHC